MPFTHSALNDLHTASRLIDEILSSRHISQYQQPQQIYCGGQAQRQARPGRHQQSYASFPEEVIIPVSAVHDLFGDVLQLAAPRANPRQQKRIVHATRSRPVAPRADVTETLEAYHIQADLPGVLKENINVSVDHDGTLTLHGHFGTTAQTPSAAAIDGAQQPAAVDAVADTASVTSHASKFKTSVADEEEEEYEEVHGEPARQTAPATDAANAQSAASAPETSAERQVQNVPQQATSSVHVTERHSGTFTRSWRFAAPIDVSAISAKMEHGVLSLTIPKKQKQNHQITIL